MLSFFISIHTSTQHCSVSAAAAAGRWTVCWCDRPMHNVVQFPFRNKIDGIHISQWAVITFNQHQKGTSGPGAAYNVSMFVGCFFSISISRRMLCCHSLLYSSFCILTGCHSATLRHFSATEDTIEETYNMRRVRTHEHMNYNVVSRNEYIKHLKWSCSEWEVLQLKLLHSLSLDGNKYW